MSETQTEDLFLDDMTRALCTSRHLLRVGHFLTKYDISRPRDKEDDQDV